MGSSNQGVEGERCRCGRSPSGHRVVSYRGSSASYRYHRCECGKEWTERVAQIDRAQPITGDELLDVHLALARLDFRLSDLT